MLFDPTLLVQGYHVGRERAAAQRHTLKLAIETALFTRYQYTLRS
jgi:hypothetical protein